MPSKELYWRYVGIIVNATVLDSVIIVEDLVDVRIQNLILDTVQLTSPTDQFTLRP